MINDFNRNDYDLFLISSGVSTGLPDAHNGTSDDDTNDSTVSSFKQ